MWLRGQFLVADSESEVIFSIKWQPLLNIRVAMATIKVTDKQNLYFWMFILHWFTFYGAFKLLILHGFTFHGGFDWFGSSLWSTAVLQVDAALLTLLVTIPYMIDSFNFNLKSLHKHWQKQCWSFYCCLLCCLTWAHLFMSSTFIDFCLFPRSVSFGAC